MDEILKVIVSLDGEWMVEGKKKSALMIAFSGTAEGPYFQGKILPHGVDTQMLADGKMLSMSARYMLEGFDNKGNTCRLFIENNGKEEPDGTIRTKPVIITDSEALRWMESEELYGTVEGAEGKVIIRIYCTT